MAQTRTKPSDDQISQMKRGAAANKAVDQYLRFISDTRQAGRPVNQTKLQDDIRNEANLARKTILIARLHNAIKREQLMAVQELREQAFLEHAAWFSEKHDISYPVWREMGVSAAVLKKSGIVE